MRQFLTVLSGVLLLAAATTTAAAASFTCAADGNPPTVDIIRGDRAKPYFSTASGPVVFRLRGPGTVKLFAKLHTDGADVGTGQLSLEGVPGCPPLTELSLKPSTKDAYAPGSDGCPSVGKKITFPVPAGDHLLRIDGGPLVRVLYDGPAQPQPKTKKKPKKKARWTFRKKAGLELIYDDNIIHYSPNLIDEFANGIAPWKFNLKTYDDLISVPSLDFEARRKLVPLGESRFRVKFKRKRYLHNPVKSHETWSFYIRQGLPNRQSLEFSYAWTPQKYIRHLTDREPFTPSDDPISWVPFRFSTNSFSTVYRFKLHKKLSAKLMLQKNLRYYNRRFLEQDLNDTGIRATLYWSMAKRWKLTGEYGFNRAWARRYDQSNETPDPDHNDDNDNSYMQNRFQLELRWKPKMKHRVFDSVALRGLHRFAAFTSPKELFEDPFHVKRRDLYYTARLTFARKMSKLLSSRLALDYTMRQVKTPYTGDISEGMDYGNFRVLLSFTYDLKGLKLR